MDDTREQQLRPAAATPQGPYTPDAQPAQVYAPPPAEPYAPSAVDVAARVMRLLGRRLAKGLMSLWGFAVPRLGWLLLTAFLLGVIGALSLALVLPRLLASGPAADSRAAMMPPAAAVDDFLRGQQTYDADLMWEALSPDLRAALEQREITRDSLAEQVESERQAGHRYRSIEYIGGVPVDGRQTMYFYAVEVQSPVPERSGTFSFIFTVGQDGKIVSIDM